MFLDTVDQFAAVAVGKAAFLRRSPLGFRISSMMAGAYVGLGIILIFCIGANVDPAIRPICLNVDPLDIDRGDVIEQRSQRLDGLGFNRFQ